MNVNQKDEDLEKLLFLYWVEDNTSEIVHDQMTQSINTETWKNGTVS